MFPYFTNFYLLGGWKPSTKNENLKFPRGARDDSTQLCHQTLGGSLGNPRTLTKFTATHSKKINGKTSLNKVYSHWCLLKLFPLYSKSPNLSWGIFQHFPMDIPLGSSKTTRPPCSTTVLAADIPPTTRGYGTAERLWLWMILVGKMDDPQKFCWHVTSW